MRKLMCIALITLSSFSTLSASVPDGDGLTWQEREMLWEDIHYYIHAMYKNLNYADREAALIGNVDIRDATQAAIEGAITGLVTRSPYGVAIGSALNTVARIAGQQYARWYSAKAYLQVAQDYADKADELQERLWTNK